MSGRVSRTASRSRCRGVRRRRDGSSPRGRPRRRPACGSRPAPRPSAGRGSRCACSGSGSGRRRSRCRGRGVLQDRRTWSPVPGGSTLITSAPRSARSIVQYGPAMTWVRSMTRTPSRAPVVWPSVTWRSPSLSRPAGRPVGRAVTLVRSVLVARGRRQQRLPDQLDRVPGVAFGPVEDLLRHETPVAATTVSSGSASTAGKSRSLPDRHGQVVVLGLEAERPGHAAASGVQFDDLDARDALAAARRSRRCRPRPSGGSGRGTGSGVPPARSPRSAGAGRRRWPRRAAPRPGERVRRRPARPDRPGSIATCSSRRVNRHDGSQPTIGEPGGAAPSAAAPDRAPWPWPRPRSPLDRLDTAAAAARLQRDLPAGQSRAARWPPGRCAGSV